jgi:two-component system, NtrC family, C4-dicarboxylate transport response regulator DctD
MGDLTVLLVDDDPNNVARLSAILEEMEIPSLSAADGREALAELARHSGPQGFPGIVISDLKMPVMDGQELLAKLHQADADLPVIMVSAYGDISSAVLAMRRGATDFIERPINADDLKERILRALRTRELVLDNRRLKTELANSPAIAGRIIGNSSAIQKLREGVASLAGIDATVLIYGATGTGKEVVARALHEFGKRNRSRFVAINCGGLSENMIESELFGHEAGAFTDAKQRRIGLAEHAKGGTLFLDEIESMPLNLQIKLLRMLQERVITRLGSNEEIKIDVRVVAATKTDLREAANRKEFREDLYYRLNVAELHIPTLNERRDDIPLLFNHFAAEFAARHQRQPVQLNPEGVQALVTHDWRGNVRELRNIAERYVLGLGTLPGILREGETGAGRSLPEQIDAIEAMLIRNVLASARGSVQTAADLLGVPRRTLSEKMNRHRIDGQDFR